MGDIGFAHVTSRREGPDLRLTLGLDDLSLELEAGRFVAVIGAPGSGKTTLLQHLNGLLRPDEGAVRVFDRRVEPDAPGGKRAKRKRGAPSSEAGLRKTVGLVFQFPEQQLFEATVEKDLRFGPRNFGCSEEEAGAAAIRAADELGLGAELLARCPLEISGGQKRKAAIAAVLAADPDVLALDEPASSLDQISRTELMRLLHIWCKDRRKTVILVTHRLEEVLPYADDYVVMQGGRCAFHGDAAALLRETEILAAAGVVVPPAVRLLAGAADRFGMPPPAPYLDPDSAAAWIKRLLAAGS